MTSPECVFDETYFECGVTSGISLYENYRWLPEVSLPMACRLKELFPNNSILDFGCAKGFLVHALRILKVTAYGYDISPYAYAQALPTVQPFLCDPQQISLDQIPSVDVIFAKDVFEHIEKTELVSVLSILRKSCQKALFIVPFGENQTYRIEAYGKDQTHIIMENEAWWEKIFRSAGFKVWQFQYRLRGFKTNWAHCFNGNGFYFLV